jgi:hypothetical protein
LDVVGIAEREAGAVKGIDDLAMGDFQFVQAD